jgi:hypothetical protein
MSLTKQPFDLWVMVRAPGRVEGCAKIAMTLLRSIRAAMGLLRQSNRRSSFLLSAAPCQFR